LDQENFEFLGMKIISELSRSRAAVVYRALHLASNCIVALKVLLLASPCDSTLGQFGFSEK
jgi:hypothetical protein